MKKIKKELADEFARKFFGLFIFPLKNVSFDSVNYFEDYPQHVIEYVVGRAQLNIFRFAPFEQIDTPIAYLELCGRFVSYFTFKNGEILPFKTEFVKELKNLDELRWELALAPANELAKLLEITPEILDKQIDDLRHIVNCYMPEGQA